MRLESRRQRRIVFRYIAGQWLIQQTHSTAVSPDTCRVVHIDGGINLSTSQPIGKSMRTEQTEGL